MNLSTLMNRNFRLNSLLFVRSWWRQTSAAWGVRSKKLRHKFLLQKHEWEVALISNILNFEPPLPPFCDSITACLDLLTGIWVSGLKCAVMSLHCEKSVLRMWVEGILQCSWKEQLWNSPVPSIFSCRIFFVLCNNGEFNLESCNHQ